MLDILALLKAAKEIVPQLRGNLALVISFLQQIQDAIGKFQASPDEETRCVEMIDAHCAAMPMVEAEIQKGKLTDFLAKFGPAALKILLALLA